MKEDFNFGRMAEQLSVLVSAAYWLGQTAVSHPTTAILACVMYLALNKAISTIRGKDA